MRGPSLFPDVGSVVGRRSTTGPHHLALSRVALLAVTIALLGIVLFVATAGTVDAKEPVWAEPWEFRSYWGWYEGDRIDYYDLGTSSNRTAPAYRLVDETQTPIEGQQLIFVDLRPGVLIGPRASANYSDFHRIWDVQVPPGYVPNDVRSLDEILASGWPMVERDLVWNTPMVPKDTELVGTSSDMYPLREGWWNGTGVYYFRFESSADTHGLFDSGSGLVRSSGAVAVFDPPGQLEILEHYHSDSRYSPLTELYIFNPISTEYIADSVRSWQEVEDLEYLVFPQGEVHNRPVVGGRTAVTRYERPHPTSFQNLRAWWNETYMVQYYDLGEVPLGVAPIYRFVSPEGMPLVRQHYIVDTVVEDVLYGDVDTAGYRPIWRVHDVTVVDTGAFEPDLIKSKGDLDATGWTIEPTDEFLVAPMVPVGEDRKARFLPGGASPPGEGLMRVWYRGADVYLVVLARDEGTGELVDPGTLEVTTSDLIVIVDGEGDQMADQRPILTALPGEEGYSPVWSVVHASGGEGFRPDRFRSRAQLEERGWSFEASGDLVMGGFWVGPFTVSVWSPANFTFIVGPVVDEDSRPVVGASVRVSRGTETRVGTTGQDGTVSFDVNASWNGKTIQVYISAPGYFPVNFPAELKDFEDFVPSGGYVQPLVEEEADGGLDWSAAYALGALVVVVIVALALLMRGRSERMDALTGAEMDEIFQEGGDEGEEGQDEGESEDLDEGTSVK